MFVRCPYSLCHVYCLDSLLAMAYNFFSSVPDITIATDIICGFPTETEEVHIMLPVCNQPHLVVMVVCSLPSAGLRRDHGVSPALPVPKPVHKPVLPSSRHPSSSHEENTHARGELDTARSTHVAISQLQYLHSAVQYRVR